MPWTFTEWLPCIQFNCTIVLMHKTAFNSRKCELQKTMLHISPVAYFYVVSFLSVSIVHFGLFQVSRASHRLEMFSHSPLGDVLSFITGANRIPTGEFENPAVSFDHSSMHPRSSTCTLHLILPAKLDTYIRVILHCNDWRCLKQRWIWTDFTVFFSFLSGFEIYCLQLHSCVLPLFKGLLWFVVYHFHCTIVCLWFTTFI